MADTGGLQKYVQDIMDRAGAALPEMMDQRDSAQQGYLSQLQRPLDTSGSDIAMYGKMAQAFSNSPYAGVGTANALQAFGNTKQAQDETQLARQDLYGKVAAGFGKENVNQALNEMKTLPSLVKGASSGTVTKMDKDGNLVSYNPTTGETKVVHSSQRGEYQRIWTKAYEKAVSEQMENPEQYAHGVAASVLGTSAPGTATPGAPSNGASTLSPSAQNANRNIPLIESELAKATGERKVILEQELAREKANYEQSAIRRPDAIASIQYQDKPELKRKEEFATGLEKGAIKDYEENIKPEAAAAASMLNIITTLKQIPRTQDAFAPWREKLGAGLQVLGMNGNMVREAENIQQVRPMLNEMANKVLNMAKGPQTEGDAQRAYGQFIKIDDTQKAVEFMYAMAEELANRAKFKENVYRTFGKKEGTMQAGQENWNLSDYANAAPVAILNGKPWTYTKWRDHPATQAAIERGDLNRDELLKTWNNLARGSK